MPKSKKGWWKKWFYLRNNANTLLHMFTGNDTTPQSNWGYGVARKDLGKLQPLHEVN
jgi:hypothetical protein